MNGKSACGVVGTVLVLSAVLTLVWAESVQAGVCPATNVIQDPNEFQWTQQSGYYMGTLELGEATLNVGGATLTTRAYRQAAGAFSIPGPTIRMTPGNTYVHAQEPAAICPREHGGKHLQGSQRHERAHAWSARFAHVAR